MKQIKLLLVGLAGVSVAAVLFACVHSASAQAPQASANTLKLVAERCDLLKTRLTGAEKTDAAVRVKRGRAYDQELLPYVSAFNSRIATHKVDAPELISIAAQLQEQAGKKFGQLYTIYADTLEAASKSDCRKDPAKTYALIQEARVDRQDVANQVKLIDRLTSDYIAELKKLEVRYTPAINKSEAVEGPQ